MSNRIGCCITGCRRTFKREDRDRDVMIICGRHWRIADQRFRDRHKQLRKRIRWLERFGVRRNKLIAVTGRTAKYENMLDRAYWRAHNAWNRVREDAEIKAALGAEDAPRRRPQVTA